MVARITLSPQVQSPMEQCSGAARLMAMRAARWCCLTVVSSLSRSAPPPRVSTRLTRLMAQSSGTLQSLTSRPVSLLACRPEVALLMVACRSQVCARLALRRCVVVPTSIKVLLVELGHLRLPSSVRLLGLGQDDEVSERTMTYKVSGCGNRLLQRPLPPRYSHESSGLSAASSSSENAKG